MLAAGSCRAHAHYAFVAVVLSAAPARAQVTRTTELILTPPTEGIVAARVRAPFRIDGVLDEAVWRGVKPATNFVQLEPHEGAPATMPSEVRMVITDDAVVFGARFEDDYRARLSAVVPPTGGSAGDYRDDYFEVQIDPHAEHLTRLALSVTPGGNTRAWLVGNDGTRDTSWTVSWEAATRIDAKSWTVEMRIPLSEFHIMPGTEHWGVQFVHFSWRRQETDVFRAAAKMSPVIVGSTEYRWRTISRAETK